MKHRLVSLFSAFPVWSASRVALAALPLCAGCSAGGNTSAAPVFGSGGMTSNGGAPAVFGGTPGASGVPASYAGTGAAVTYDGGVIVNPPVDPGIKFNWPVDDPNPAGLTCQPGHYAGAFAGLYTSPITVVGVPIPVVGDVNLTLTQSTNGEFFTITNGTVTGRADILAEYRCAFNGTLNCTTKKLEMGSINCGYCVGAYVPEGGICLGLESHFIGPLTGDYNGASQSFENATWSGKEGADSGVFGGSGIWTAAYMP